MSKPKIAFAWSGFPDYAARCLGELVGRGKVQVDVLATAPTVPIKGMEASLGQPFCIVDRDDRKLTFQSAGIELPDLFFCGGYSVPAFRALAQQCKLASVPTVLLADNNIDLNWAKRIASTYRHKLLHKRKFCGVLVPGDAGVKYAKSIGYNHADIHRGLYSADPKIFGPGVPLSERRKELLFVGRLVGRKNVNRLVSAFNKFSAMYPEWELQVFGTGPLEDLFRANSRIKLNGFVQPIELAARMRRMRCLILPSMREHFGLVVHEAVLSGCALALSDSVGAAADFAKPSNSVLFDPSSESNIFEALCEMARWDDRRWDRAGQESIRLSSKYSPQKFANTIDDLINQYVKDANCSR